MKYPELIEFDVVDATEGMKVGQALQRIVRRLDIKTILEIDAAMQKDPQIIPKVLKAANHPIVKNLFKSLK